MRHPIRSRAAPAVLALALCAAHAACTASGAIRAQVAGPGGGAPVAMQYRSERFGLNGTMTATLPDGQRYSGSYLQVTSDTDATTLDPFWGAWDVGWGNWGPWQDDEPSWAIGADMPTFIRNYSGKVIALLLSDRGGHMRCRFHLANPSQGIEGGGLGECETNSGTKIDATF